MNSHSVRRFLRYGRLQSVCRYAATASSAGDAPSRPPPSSPPSSSSAAAPDADDELDVAFDQKLSLLDNAIVDSPLVAPRNADVTVRCGMCGARTFRAFYPPLTRTNSHTPKRLRNSRLSMGVCAIVISLNAALCSRQILRSETLHHRGRCLRSRSSPMALTRSPRCRRPPLLLLPTPAPPQKAMPILLPPPVHLMVVANPSAWRRF